MSAVQTKSESKIKRLRIEISGIVQGVGFRPFVHKAANIFELRGFVGNESKGVFLEVEGDAEKLQGFVKYLPTGAPPLSYISKIEVREIPVSGENDFRIIESISQAADFTLISPDITICEDCLKELFDPQDRRYLYPFINCTNCGPRFTITKTVPYDRPNTTMANFAMCDACRAEYENQLDRRFHAQPISCWDCGVQASFVGDTSSTPRSAVKRATEALKKGRIVAVKGIGGFHLACDARDEAAIRKLRERKGRVDKPFAVMCRNLETAQNFVHLDKTEAEILTSKERPIVLLKKKSPNILSEWIAPNNNYLGVMLPYAPLQYLLFDEDLDVLVMTSGNYSNEPIVKDNDEALNGLARLADEFLIHDREIFVQCDDSVVRVCEKELNDRSNAANLTPDALLPYRRSRGYAPFPVELPFDVPPLLAVGGELKAAFCLTKGNFAFMSQHIGDMENIETLRAFEQAAEQMKRLFRVEPEAAAGDLHPNYLSSNWAKRNFSRFIGVQHHHAHIASVMAENGIADEKVIGFAFDGTGYGLDGAIWGGEVFCGDYAGFERLAHLRYFRLAGGDVSIKNVYRLALTILRESGIDWTEELPCVSICPETERKILRAQLARNLNVVETSSFGRLFDAVASLAGIRHKATYEAQAAIEFEAVQNADCSEFYGFDINGGVIDYRRLVRAVVEDIRKNTPASIVSAKFHNGVARLIVELSLIYGNRLKLNKIALSGGCFQNAALLEKIAARLREKDFEVLTHKIVPPNDGGLALGQAVIAARRLKQN